jgi:hypothetical protein
VGYQLVPKKAVYIMPKRNFSTLSAKMCPGCHVVHSGFCSVQGKIIIFSIVAFKDQEKCLWFCLIFSSIKISNTITAGNLQTVG